MKHQGYKIHLKNPLKGENATLRYYLPTIRLQFIAISQQSGTIDHSAQF